MVVEYSTERAQLHEIDRRNRYAISRKINQTKQRIERWSMRLPKGSQRDDADEIALELVRDEEQARVSVSLFSLRFRRPRFGSGVIQISKSET